MRRYAGTTRVAAFALAMTAAIAWSGCRVAHAAQAPGVHRSHAVAPALSAHSDHGHAAHRHSGAGPQADHSPDSPSPAPCPLGDCLHGVMLAAPDRADHQAAEQVLTVQATWQRHLDRNFLGQDRPPPGVVPPAQRLRHSSVQIRI